MLHDLCAPSLFTHSLERNGANNFCLYIARPLSLWGGVYCILYISYLERHVIVLFGGDGMMYMARSGLNFF